MPGRYSRNSVALDRTFVAVNDEGKGLSSEQALAVARSLHREETWAQLLHRPYVVVLGEAGTGKSTEFDRQAVQLSSERQWAFFVEITSLASNGLISSVDLEDSERIKAWRDTDARAIFFLDSLDEAKLRRHTLRDALRQLRNAVHAEWSRVALVISCRASDWMAGADRDEIEAVIPDGSGATVHVVQIAPLEAAQVEKLAAHVGVTDVASFMTAIDDNYAQVFIERPLDVKWLGGYWNTHRRIGSLRELIDDDIREKLRERPGRVSTLPKAKAAEGLQALAGVATLTRRYSFLVPDESFELVRGDSAVDPHEVLHDWSDDEIQQLLRRPIFDESSYGRVRIHHRSVQEFLAARWFYELLAAGMTRTTLESLFLRRTGREQAVPQHLGPVLAWLCLWDAELRSKMLTEIPALLIGHGDPSGFSDDERRTILRAYASRYKDRGRQFQRFELPSLDRFSCPTLAEPIAALLALPETPEDLAAMLLQLVEHGRIAECAPIALSLAMGARTPNYIRSYAIRAAAALGRKAELLPLLDQLDVWDQDVAGSFVRALYPAPLDAGGVIRVIARAARKPRNQTTSLQVVLEFEVQKLGDVEHRLDLLERLLKHMGVECLDGQTQVDHEHNWLLPMVGRLVEALLEELGAVVELPLQVMEALDLFRSCSRAGTREWYGLDGVRKAVSQYPEVRRALFWRHVDALRKKAGVPPTRQHEVVWSIELYKPSLTDVDWLARDAVVRGDVRERLLAFDVLLNMSCPEEERARYLEFLRQVGDTDPALGRRLQRWLNPRPYFHYQTQVFQRQSKARDNARERQDKQNCDVLLQQIDMLRSGDDIANLWFLWNEAKHMSSWTWASHESLKEKYGIQIAEAARDGWRAIWRKLEPVLPHAREHRNTTPGFVLLGLTGLHSEFADGLSVSTLCELLVIRATGYAASELNQFPTWLADLAEVRPALVAKTLEPALGADYGSTEVVYDVLAKLAYSDVSLRLACAPIVAQLVEARDPPTLEALRQALTVLLSTESEAVSILNDVAETRCKAAISDRPRFVVWWHCWLNLDGTRALDYLVEALSEIPHQEASHLIEGVCNRLHDCTKGHSLLPLYVLNDPAALSRLLPLVHTFIKPEDDPKYEGVHFIGPREHAQDFRDKLPGWLAAIPGEASVEALRSAANNPALVGIRDWLLHLADQRLVADAGITSTAAQALLVQLYRQFGLGAIRHLGPLAGTRDEVLGGSLRPGTTAGAAVPSPDATSPAQMANAAAPVLDVPTTSHTYQFAFTFAGEDRAVVKELAEKLKAQGISVFYDEFEEGKLWGKDLYEYLADIYRHKARFCIMLISQHYATKAWTNHQRKAAQARAFTDSREYILPLRLDDTEIPGMHPTVGYLDLRKRSIDDIVRLALLKIQEP